MRTPTARNVAPTGSEYAETVRSNHCKYTAGLTKCNTKKDQRYHSEIYLAENMFYKDQTIKITVSCDVWMMTKSVVSVAVIVGYYRCRTSWLRIKEVLAVSFGYNSPWASSYCES
ncbi:uncharacterized protein TNCV_1327121 [Trichonephila clavipes]|nr:uncharacterized protein TNCV_1327121 [Trichonephila clavipes]